MGTLASLSQFRLLRKNRFSDAQHSMGSKKDISEVIRQSGGRAAIALPYHF